MTNWVNSTPAGINLDSLTDVVVSSPTNGQQITYNGTNWINSTPAGATAKESLAASVGGGHADSMGGSYVDMLAYQIDGSVQ